MSVSSSPDLQPKSLTPKQRQAAILLAEDELTDQAIADQLGVTKRTIATWKTIPEIKDQIASYVDELEDLALSRSFARKSRRLARYEKRLDAIDTLITERGAEMADEVPGGGTGLLLRIPKTVKHTYEPDPEDPDGKEIVVHIETNEYREATQLLKEEREILKQYAIETGQFAERREHTGANGTPIQISAIEVVLDEVVGDPEGDA